MTELIALATLALVARNMFRRNRRNNAPMHYWYTEIKANTTVYDDTLIPFNAAWSTLVIMLDSDYMKG